MAPSFPALPQCPPLARQAASSGEVGIGAVFGRAGLLLGVAAVATVWPNGARVWVWITPLFMAVLGCSTTGLVVLPPKLALRPAIFGSEHATNNKSGMKIKRRISRPILCAIKPDPQVSRKPELCRIQNHLENIYRTFYIFLCPQPCPHLQESRWPICQCAVCMLFNPWWVI